MSLIYKVTSTEDPNFGYVFFFTADEAKGYADSFNDTVVIPIELGFRFPINQIDLHDYLVFLNDTNVNYVIKQTDEAGELLWAIIPSSDDQYWMGSFGTRDEAVEFCKLLGLKTVMDY